MDSITLDVETGRRPTVVDLTSSVSDFVGGRGDGLLSVFVPHATAGIAIIEVGAGSDHDLLGTIDDLLPLERGRWRHEHGTPGHGRDHVLPAFIAPSVTIPVVDGRVQLGTWQSIVLVDPNADNPRRRVIVSFLAG